MSACARLWALVPLLAFSAPNALHAQIAGVNSGYTLDGRSGSIRAVLGVPGAARLGSPAPLGISIAQAAIANHRAVVISGERTGHVWMILDLSVASPAVQPIAGAIGEVTSVLINSTGVSALLYSKTRDEFQFVTGIDTTPVAGHPFPASLLSGKFSAAAVAESSPCALLASSDSAASYIQEACAASPAALTAVAQLPGARITALAWLRQDQDALIADAAGNQILLLPNFAEGAAAAVIAGPADGIQSPAALLALGTTSFAAINSGSPELILADAANPSAARSIALPAAPSRLEFLGSAGILACTRIGAGPLLLVDPRQNFASFFVPMN